MSKRPLIVMGLEGSANKLAVGIVDSLGNTLANVRDTYNAPPGAGFIPTVVTDHHRKYIVKLIKKALESAKLTPKDIDYIAYTRGPGMGGPLASVAVVARCISQLWKCPLVAVNHCVAHIEMGRHASNLENPVALYASGGNTQVIAYSHGKYRIFGEALDIPIGNCLDRFARVITIPNDPSPGRNIELYAEKWLEGYKKEIENLPEEIKNDPEKLANGKYIYSMYHKKIKSLVPKMILNLPLCVKGMDISCSGVNTSLEKLVNEPENQRILKLPDNSIEKMQFKQMLCYTLQETLFSALVEITERAAAHVGAKDVLAVGGVGCNERLQQMLNIMASERGGTVGAMDDRYCVDNGVMIAWLGVLHIGAETNRKYKEDPKKEFEIVTEEEHKQCYNTVLRSANGEPIEQILYERLDTVKKSSENDDASDEEDNTENYNENKTVIPYTKIELADVTQRFRTDQVNVIWRD